MGAADQITMPTSSATHRGPIAWQRLMGWTNRRPGRARRSTSFRSVAAEVCEPRILLTTFVVDEPGDAVGMSGTTIREAIEQANAAAGFDTVVIPQGLQATLAQGEIVISDSVGIEVAGVDTTADLATVDAGGASRIFRIDSLQTGGEVQLSGLRLTGGASTGDGGAVLFAAAGELMLDGVVMDGNSAGRGGAIAIAAGADLFAENTSFGGNAADSDGGALHFDGGGSLTIADSDFGGQSRRFGLDLDGNAAAADGGAVWLGDASVSMFGAHFVGNTAGDDGGAIRADGAGVVDPLIGIGSRSDFVGNIAGDRGGALSGSEASFLVSQTRFFGNAAAFGGAADQSTAASSMTFDDVDFRNNTAEIAGGAILTGGDLTAERSLFADNAAARSGGAISTRGEASTTAITRSDFLRNAADASQGGAIDHTDGSLAIAGGRFLDNRAGTSGGGIRAGSSATLSETYFAGNRSATGGGIFANTAVTQVGGTILTLIDVTLERNWATGTGGAIGLANAETRAVLSNSLIRDNGVDRVSGADATVDGGGIAAAEARVELRRTTVRRNSATRSGGGLLIDRGELVANRSTDLVGNRAGLRGGGIAADQAEIELRGTVRLNAAGTDAAADGGGVFADRSRVEIVDATFDGNSATRNGGGLFFTATAASDTIVATGVIFVRNAAGGTAATEGGGAIFYRNDAARLNVFGGRFFDNTSAGSGGAVLAESNVALLRASDGSRATFRRNEAIRHGGAIYSARRGTFVGAVLADNAAGGFGGAVMQFAGVATSRGSVFIRNESTGSDPGSGLGGAVFVRTSYASDSDRYLDNVAEIDGGALFARSGATATLTSPTFSGNSPNATAGPGTFN